MEIDRLEGLADVLFESVRVYLDTKVAAIAARIDAVERSFLAKADASVLFANPKDINAQIEREITPLRDAIGLLRTDVAAKPGIDLVRAEQSAQAMEAASKLFATLHVPVEPAAPVDVRSTLELMVAALPKPTNGKDADPEVIRELVAKAVAEIPRPKDGASIDPEAVRAQILAEVTRQVGAIPKPNDGEPGRSLSVDDIRPVVALAVEAEIGKAVATIPRAIDGKSFTLEDARPIINAAIAAIPIPKDGKSVDPVEVEAMVDAEVSRAVASIPLPRDGTSVDLDQVKGMVDAEVARAIAALPIPKDGKDADFAMLNELVKTSVRAAVADIPTPKDGENAEIDMAEVGRLIEREVRTTLAEWPRPLDGKDGFGFDDFATEVKDDGRTIIATFTRGTEVKRFEWVFPWQIYRGVYTRGARYLRGDTVTYAGSQFTAKVDTDKPPETSDWLLSVKRGRDAKDAA